jgi:hypothetical protein
MILTLLVVALMVGVLFFTWLSYRVRSRAIRWITLCWWIVWGMALLYESLLH